MASTIKDIVARLPLLLSDSPLRLGCEDSEAAGKPRLTYGAEDVDDDRWTLLHWASYNGSSKVKRLLLLEGADPEHLNVISLGGKSGVVNDKSF